MAALPAGAKVLIVRSLACYESPTAIVELVKQEFNIVVTRQQISAYNPENTMAKNLGQKWVDLFNQTRERFRVAVTDIPIANKAYRLRVLDRMATRTEGMKNFALTAQLIEQAAKECGDAYSNKLKVETTGANGGPIQAEVKHLSADEAVAIYQKFMG